MFHFLKRGVREKSADGSGGIGHGACVRVAKRSVEVVGGLASGSQLCPVSWPQLSLGTLSGEEIQLWRHPDPGPGKWTRGRQKAAGRALHARAEKQRDLL